MSDTGDYGLVRMETGEIIDDFLTKEECAARRLQWHAGPLKMVRLWKDNKSIRPEGLWKRSEDLLAGQS